jgi:hypothetical protein
MRAYSQDLCEWVIADCDLGMTSSQVAANDRVSESWVRWLTQHDDRPARSSPSSSSLVPS